MSKRSDVSQQEMEYWRADVAKIKEDSSHGSIYLANAAIDIVEEFVEKQLYKNRTELIQALSKLSNALVRAKPLMALIYNRTRHVIGFIQDIPKEQKDIDVIKRDTLAEIQSMRKSGKIQFGDHYPLGMPSYPRPSYHFDAFCQQCC